MDPIVEPDIEDQPKPEEKVKRIKNETHAQKEYNKEK